MTISPKSSLHIWYPLSGYLPLLDGALSVHQAALAYASDYHFLSTSLQPHGVAVTDKSLRIATIDHAMWFHKPVKIDEWHLFSYESTRSSGSRGFTRAEIFTRDGELVASTTQEGLMRLREQ